MAEYVHAGRVVARTLRALGCTHLFTLCSGHTQSIYDGCLDEDIRVVDFRHEQAAGFAADAWGRLTGLPGVVVVAPGPGFTNALTPLANAQRAGSPLLLIAGQGPLTFSGRGSLQEMNMLDVARPLTKWAAVVPDAQRLPEFIALAWRRALSGVPGPVYLEMPLDVLFQQVDLDALEWPWPGGAAIPPMPRLSGDPAQVARAAELLLHAERPVAIVGSQLRWSPEWGRLRAFAEAFHAPVYLNGMARGALPPEDRHFFARSRKAALEKADVVVVFGTPLDFRLGYGRSPVWNDQAALIQVDLDPAELGRNRAPHVAIVGESALVMGQLMAAAVAAVGTIAAAARQAAAVSAGTPAPEGRGGPGDGDTRVGNHGTMAAASHAGQAAQARDGWIAHLRAIEDQQAARMEAGLRSDAVPVDPLRCCHEIELAIDDLLRAAAATEPPTIVGDGGDFVATAAAIVRPRRYPAGWLDPGPLGTLGIGPSFAMAAKLARPGAPVLCILGDGSAGFNLMEYEAAVRQNIPFVGVIGNDAAWTQIRRGQVMMYGEARAVATGLDHTRYDRVVEALGGHGEYVERPEDIRPAIARAFASGKPALVNIKVGASDFRAGAISV